LASIGISFVTEFSVEYPDLWKSKLGNRVPSHLFVAGNVGLLRMASLGVVGSRDIDDAGTAFTERVAHEAVSQGLSIISGGARGVDEVAMKSALDAGGSAVGILAESLAKSMRKWDLDSERICLATPFAPDIGFQVANAMSRNKLIYAGSEATVVVSSALESGGTWAGATEALKQNLCPLLVRGGDGVPEGNRALLGKGGIEITEPDELMRLLVAAQPVQGSLL
jgi:DNA processing protein